MRLMLVGAALLLSACGSVKTSAKAQAKAQAKVQADLQAEDLYRLHGTVEAIRFQNINKRLGHYSYNVTLRLRLTDPVPEHPDWSDPRPEVVSVRTQWSMPWSKISEAERATVAPDGPKSALTPKVWRGYEIGAAVTLDVTGFPPLCSLKRQITR